MKRIALAACAALIISAPAPALAEPMPMPEVDYEGDWQMDPANGVSAARIHFSAARGAFRIDMTTDGGDASIVRDMANGEMLIWGAMSRGMAMKLKSPNRIPEGERTGETDEVNGEPCAVWQGSEVRMCMSEDNIPLSATAHGTAVRLLNIERRGQAASLFELPAGVELMELPPAMLKQMEKMQGAMPGKNALPF